MAESKQLDSMLAKIQKISENDIENEELKERIEEYIELMRIKEELINVILKLMDEQEKVTEYTELLKADLEKAHTSLEDTDEKTLARIIKKYSNVAE